MKEPLKTHERMSRIFNHEEPDRVPMHDSPWGSTVQRWRKEGLPAGLSPGEFFGWDTIVRINHDNSPRYPEKVIEETDEYVIRQTKWGVTLRNWREHGGVPEFLDFTITDHDSWAEAKERMKPGEDRVDWEHLRENYPKWKEQGAWIIAGAWFGYDVLASWTVGYERMLVAMVQDPDWARDMAQTQLDCNIGMMEMIWDRG
ncbi:MAG: hypothetical protein R6V19_01720, partial [Armatimonadota bacterium]